MKTYVRETDVQIHFSHRREAHSRAQGEKGGDAEDGNLWKSLNELARCGIPFEAITPRTVSRTATSRNLFHDVALTAGGIENALLQRFDADLLVGVDAAHSREKDRTNWACMALDTRGRILALASGSSKRDESLRFCSSGPLMRLFDAIAARHRPMRVLVHRDGREFKDDFRLVDVAARSRFALACVPVIKHHGVLLYREGSYGLENAAFGDALVSEEHSAAFVSLTAPDGKRDVAPIKVRRPAGVSLDRAVTYVVASSLLPKPGVWFESPLPATSYWADRFSKESVSDRRRVVGRAARHIV